MSAARLSLTFKIFRGDQLVREETLTQGVIKIGKVPSAHLRIDDESVSRMHAILEVDNVGGVHVIDLGSTRGTFVNGQKINKAKLESGDALQLGSMRIEVAFKPLAAAEPAAAASGGNVVVAPVMAVPPLPAPAALPPPVPVAVVRAPAISVPMTQTQAAFATLADDEGGAKAIEVAAMLGDSVVGVKHCIDPKSGKISPTTWGFFAAGAASLVASVIAFSVSVSTAAFNKGGLDYWTHIAKKPAGAFRPEMLSAAYDWVAFGGLALGLVAMVAGLLRMRAEKRTPYYRVGTAPGVEMALETAPSPSFPLVAPSADGDDFVFNYGAGIDGELILDGKSTSLAELFAAGKARPSMSTAGAIELPIPARAKIRARSGQTTFMVSAVPQPRHHATPLLAGLENRTLAYLGGSLVAHLAVWALLAQIPADDSSATIEIDAMETTTINGTTTINEVTPPKPEDDSGGGGTTGAGKAMNLPEGQSGRPEVTATDRHIAIKNNNLDPQMARNEAIEHAIHDGVMGDMPALTGAISTISATGNIESGFDDASFYGAEFGAEAGDAHGYFGMGRSGFGRGGGCTQEPCGLYGSGQFNTIGGGQHAGQGWNGPGGFGPGMRHREPGVPRAIVGQPTGGGDLDKAIIRRYIKRNLDKITYCYEHESLGRSAFEGTVTVQFFITPNGNVTGSVGTGFDSKVSTCVAEVVGRIEFPKPQGGGGVQVNYPFTFRFAGQ